MEKLLVCLQYEQLPNLCFHCGLFAHIVCNYPLLSQESTLEQLKNFQYGSWLHALAKLVLLEQFLFNTPMECNSASSPKVPSSVAMQRNGPHSPDDVID